jgi:hypothetical protein
VAGIEHQTAMRLRDVNTRYVAGEPLPKFPTRFQ